MLVEILIIMNFISYLGHGKTSDNVIWFTLRPHRVIKPISAA